MTQPIRYYEIDAEGWVGISVTIEEKNRALEWQDVKENEYLVIDHGGWLYTPVNKESEPWGYYWQRSSKRNSEAAQILKYYDDGDQLGDEDFQTCRSNLASRTNRRSLIQKLLYQPAQSKPNKSVG